MADTTLKYKRILPDVSVAYLKNKESGKKFYRHRFRQAAKRNSLGQQDHKDYSTRRFKDFDEFKAYIIDKFDYE